MEAVLVDVMGSPFVLVDVVVVVASKRVTGWLFGLVVHGTTKASTETAMSASDTTSTHTSRRILDVDLNLSAGTTLQFGKGEIKSIHFMAHGRRRPIFSFVILLLGRRTGG